MSHPDSFIDEVTEEVRRDRLFNLFRRYGWIGIAAVVLIVGGAAVNEWRKSQAQARAESFGDAVLESLDMTGPERVEALSSIPATGEQTAILQLLLASDPEGDKEAALAALTKLADDPDQPQIYRDLASLRRVLVAGTDLPVADRRAALDPIAAPGRPFGVLAREQLAYLLAEDGKTDEAIAALTAVLTDAEATAGQQARIRQMIAAMGGEVPPVETGANAG